MSNEGIAVHVPLYHLGNIILLVDLTPINIGYDSSDSFEVQQVTVAKNKLTSTTSSFFIITANDYVEASSDQKELLTKAGWEIEYVEYPKIAGEGGTVYHPGDTFDEVINGDSIYITIKAAAAKKSYDLSTSSKWAALADGDHQVTIVAKGTGYRDSNPSTPVAVTKGSAAPLSVSWVMGSKSGTNTAGESGSVSTSGDYGDTATATFTCSGGTGTYTHTLTKVSGDSYCTATQSGNVITVNMGSGTQDDVTGEYTLIIKSDTESVTYSISYGFYCLTGDTLITLADGSQKRVDQLTLGDKVLSYNPDTMQLEADEITYTDSTENKKHTEYDVWTFSDGTIVKTVHRHRLYNVEKQAMVYMAEWNFGEHAVNIDGERIELVGHENIKEEVKHYTIFTKHQNYFANGLLCGNRYTKPLHLQPSVADRSR